MNCGINDMVGTFVDIMAEAERIFGRMASTVADGDERSVFVSQMESCSVHDVGDVPPRGLWK